MFSLKVVGIWAVRLLIAVANGGARRALLARRVSERTAHQISSVTLSLLILLVTVAFVPAFGVRAGRALSGVGALWLVLTALLRSSSDG